MNKMWMNPSRTARIWDPTNNRTLEPGEKTNIRPHAQLVQSGKLIEVKQPGEEIIQSNEPITVIASALDFADPTTKKKRK